MKAYAVALIACGSVAAALIFIFCCFCKSGRKKKSHPVSTRNVTSGSPATPPPIQANRDVEKGEVKAKSNTTMRDGGMVVLGAGAATVGAAAVVTSAYSGGGGGGGCGGGGCGGGGCGGGGCGGCGG